MSNRKLLIEAFKEAGSVALFMTLALYIPIPVIIVGLKFANQTISPNVEVPADDL